jgi:hypothetical protein
MYISGFEDVIYGEDGQSPIEGSIQRYLDAAKNDGVRLRIEIRTKPKGVPSSRQEHLLTVDPESTAAQSVMRALLERLQESPGDAFEGQLRINFAQAGSAAERYGSFTRTLQQAHSHAEAQPTPFEMALSQQHQQPPESYGQTEEEEEDWNAEEGEMPPYFQQGEQPQMPQHQQGMRQAPNVSAFTPAQMDKLLQLQMSNMVDQATARQWLDASMAFTFRSMASQMAMFERATRLLENFVLRFGLPNQGMGPGIVEEAKNQGQGGLGILPMLLNAAAQFAQADSPQGVVNTAVNMAGGQAPPQGAAREMAIKAAGNAVSQLGKRKRLPPPAAPVEAPYPEPDPGPMDDGGGEGGYFDEDMDEDLDFEAQDMGGDEMPDLNGLTGAEMKQTVIEWIRADPSRKKDVMEMLPDLSKEVM